MIELLHKKYNDVHKYMFLVFYVSLSTQIYGHHCMIDVVKQNSTRINI